MGSPRVTVPVWAYWEGDRPPYIDACLETIARHTTDLRLLDPPAFERLRAGDPDLGTINLSKLHVAHRADVIRAFLLARFGGLWIDADCLVMRPLDSFVEWAMHWDLAGFRERSPNVSNSFFAARPGSPVMRALLTRICQILTSGQPLAWTALGSEALTATLHQLGTPWLDIDVDLIQPVCWSDPGVFFARADSSEHERVFNERALCYMLANTMNQGYLADHPEADLLARRPSSTSCWRGRSEPRSAPQLPRIAYRAAVALRSLGGVWTNSPAQPAESALRPGIRTCRLRTKGELKGPRNRRGRDSDFQTENYCGICGVVVDVGAPVVVDAVVDVVVDRPHLRRPRDLPLGLGAGQDASEGMAVGGVVELRDVTEDDVPIFYEHQLDPDAVRMAAFPARSREAHLAHWVRILANETGDKQTILVDGQVAGNIVSFDQDGERDVGYWIGKAYWGKGIATKALAAFLDHETARPLYAHVATFNVASIHVLEKCGFVMCGEAKGFPGPDGEDVDEVILRLAG